MFHHEDKRSKLKSKAGGAKLNYIDGTHNISHPISGFHNGNDSSPAHIGSSHSNTSSPPSPHHHGHHHGHHHKGHHNSHSNHLSSPHNDQSSGYSSDENSVGSASQGSSSMQRSTASKQASVQSGLLAPRQRHQLTAEDISITNRVLRAKVDEIAVPGSHIHAESTAHSQSSHAAGGETAHHKARMMWKQAFLKFEKFRITKGHSLTTIFNVLNPRNYDAVGLRSFASSLSDYCPDLSFREAYSIACACDINNKNEVSMKDLLHLQSVAGASLTIGALLEQHPIFPDWLSNREDFQSYFAEWEEFKGPPPVQAVEQALEQRPEIRNSGESMVCQLFDDVVIRIINMCLLGHHALDEILPDVTECIDVCASKVNGIFLPSGRTVFKENDPGDAFYACVRGSLKVQIAGQIVKLLEPGNVFGELALERNVPRSATVVSTSDCVLIHLLAAEYTRLLAAGLGAQVTSNRASNLVVEFISSSVPNFRSLDIQTITHLVQGSKCVSYNEGDQIVIQDEPCSCLCIVLSGKVRIMRKLDLDSVWLNATVINSPDSYYTGPNMKGSLSVSVTTFDAGRIFGDDFVYLRRHRYSYSAMAIGKKTDILFCPKVIALECLDQQSIDQLRRTNTELYESDLDLILRREALIRSKLVDGRPKQTIARHAMMDRARPAVTTQLQPLPVDSSGSPTSGKGASPNRSTKMGTMKLAPLIGGMPATVMTNSTSRDEIADGLVSPMTASPPDSPKSFSKTSARRSSKGMSLRPINLSGKSAPLNSARVDSVSLSVDNIKPAMRSTKSKS